MNAKFLFACLLMLGIAMTFAAGPLRKTVTVDPDDPRLFPNVADPNDPEKTRPTISREKREQLGLTPKTWSGIVQPEVYTTLERLSQTVASLEDRLKKGRDSEAFHALWRIRFPGMVYVQVQVKDSVVQRRVLASLEASEFHVPYLFETRTGFTGYITKEGLNKLANNPDVTGVCLDDKPLPGRGPIIPKDILPPAKPGEVANEPGVAEGKVDPDIYRAFALSDRMDVMVALRGESLPELTDKGPEAQSRLELRKKVARQLQNLVLSTINAEEFWVQGRSRFSLTFHGSITRDGLQKLWKHPDVQRIALPERRRIPEHNLRPRL